MTKKTNVINHCILFFGTLLSIILCYYFAPSHIFKSLKMLYSVLVFVLLNTVVHELCHLFVGLSQGFQPISVRFLCFSFQKCKNKVKFSFSGLGEQLGEIVLVPKRAEDLENRYVKVALAGTIGNGVVLLLSVACVVLWGVFSRLFVDFDTLFFNLTAFSLPVSLYFVLENALPTDSDYLPSDAAVVYGIKHHTDDITVRMSLLKAQAYLYEGKTFSEIPKELLFDVPQLCEEDPTYRILLFHRYHYYLDKGETEKALETFERLKGLSEYFFKKEIVDVDLEELFLSCTLLFDADKADDLFESYEKTINNDFSARSMRIRLAYVLYVIGDKDAANPFYEEGIALSDNEPLLGLSAYEKRLLKRVKRDRTL